jgi:hypothetical protein
MCKYERLFHVLGIGTWFQCGELYAYKVGLVLVASTTSKSKV